METGFFFLTETYHWVRDSGPLYKETLLPGPFLEPFNSFSSLAFWIPAFYFFFRLFPQRQTFGFLVWCCCPLLFLGGTGSALFHGLRSSDVLLAMDVLPIVLLCIAVAGWLWKLVFENTWKAIGIMLLFIGLQALVQVFTEDTLAINSGYFIRGTMMFLPAILLIFRYGNALIAPLLAGILGFGIALFFRYWDSFSTFPEVGTHFLWHIFGAIGAYFLGEFIYRLSGLRRMVF